MFYIVSYDIPNNKRRKKVADLLEGYGKRVQLSVFECELSDKQFKEMYQRIQKCVNYEEDNIRFYPVSSHTMGQVIIIGSVPLTSAPGSIVV
jgi:CRISPR-associated protein Cas2